MSTRFHLRFDGGERDGETVPVPRSGLLVGRRPGNDLLLESPSVSGRHALLRPDGDALRVEDMASTNGTRVAGRKVESASLAHGDTVVFGDVAFVVVDGEATGPDAAAAPLEAAPPPASPPATGLGLELEDEIELGGPPPAAMPAVGAGGAGAGGGAAVRDAAAPTPTPSRPAAPRAPEPALAADESLHTIDSALVERTSGSRWTTIAAASVLVAGAAAAGWAFFGPGGDEVSEGAAAAAPLARPGNLLRGGDLELDAESFLSVDEGSGARPYAERAAAASGRAGLAFELAPSSSLRASTVDVSVRAGQELSAIAELRVDGGLPAAVGLELFSSDGALSTVTYSAAVAADGQWHTVEVRGRVRPGFDRARLALVAGPAGASGEDPIELAVDDLGLVPSPEPVAPLERGAFEFELSPPDSRRLLVLHAFSPLFSASVGPHDAPAAEHGRLSLEPAGPHLRLTHGGGAGPLVLEVPGRAGERSAATQGADGFRERSRDFEAQQVSALVLGSGPTQLRLAFDRPVSLSSVATDLGARIVVDLDGADGLTVQTDFGPELAQAVDLAARARAAVEAGRLGDALAAWGELRERCPFEPEYLREAESSRAELLSAGLTDLAALEVELERARFFQLPGVYAACEERAARVVAAYRPSDPEARGSDVLERAVATLEAIRAERVQLGLGDDLLEPERRARILDWAERSDAATLTRRLRADG
jgi:hypothetical protein